MIRIWIFIVIVVAGLCGVAWANDFVSLQGERTIYTAQCEQGSWNGKHCSGRLAAGPRYRFRALKAHREVIFWTVAVASEPSGKLTDCTIRDGGLMNNHHFDDQIVKAVYTTCVESGIDYMEIGYKASRKIIVPGEHGAPRGRARSLARW